MKNKIIKKGFTLAEMLIAMSVLGIIAACVIPVLIKDTNKKVYVAALKTNYNLIRVATSEIMATNSGTMANVLVDSEDTATLSLDMMNKYAAKMKFIKLCNPGEGSGECYHNGKSAIKNLHGDEAFENPNPDARAIMVNGSLLRFVAYTSDCDNDIYKINGVNATCGKIDIDVNGFKPPNTIGKDIFEILITKYGAYPNGCQSTLVFGVWNTYCNVSSANIYSGSGCAGRIFDEGKMNY